MFKFNPFKKPAHEPLKSILNTIFEYADKEQAREVVFEPQRVEEPTEVEGMPMPVVPAGSTVLFVFYKIADRLEWQLKFGDNVKEALLEQLKGYEHSGWHIEFSRTGLGERAIAQRV